MRLLCHWGSHKYEHTEKDHWGSHKHEHTEKDHWGSHKHEHTEKDHWGSHKYEHTEKDLNSCSIAYPSLVRTGKLDLLLHISQSASRQVVIIDHAAALRGGHIIWRRKELKWQSSNNEARLMSNKSFLPGLDPIFL